MPAHERHTNARDRAVKYFTQNDSDELPEKIEKTTETHRILTVRKLCFLLLLLSTLALGTGRAIFYPSGIAEHVLDEQNNCVEKYQAHMQIVCKALAELEKFNNLPPEDARHAFLKVNILAVRDKKIIYNSGFVTIDLQTEKNLTLRLDQYRQQLIQLNEEKNLSTFYVSVDYFKEFETNSLDGHLKGEVHDHFWGAYFAEEILNRFPGLKPLRISRFIRVLSYDEKLGRFSADEYVFSFSDPNGVDEYAAMGPYYYTRDLSWLQRVKVWEILANTPKFVQEIMIQYWESHPPR